jgi:adenylyl-sulfate kinase
VADPVRPASGPVSRNIVWSHSRVDAASRAAILGHGAATLWFTGLSGSGKSTIALEVEEILAGRGVAAYVLDGDNVRHGLNADLGFAPHDREENIRRVGEVCRLFGDAGLVVLTAFISPYRRDRQRVRAMHLDVPFLEVFVDTPIDVCEARDPKGLYRKARAGEIPDFSGISAPYEVPEDPDLRIPTAELTVADAAGLVIAHLEHLGVIPGSPSTDGNSHLG